MMISTSVGARLRAGTEWISGCSRTTHPPNAPSIASRMPSLGAS